MQGMSSSWAIRLGFGAVIAIGLGSYLFLLPQSERATTADPQPAPAQTVATVRPKRADIARSFDTNGTLEAFDTAELYPKISGYLSEVRVDIGDRVKQGQVLAVISVPEIEKELAEAEAVVVAKRADMALQQVTLERQERLLSAQGTSQQAYDEASSKSMVAAAQADLAAATVDKIRAILGYSRILAPFDGVVADRLVSRGDFVQSASAGRTTPLFTVQRVDVIRVYCNVPESDVSRIRVGLRASVRPYGLEGKTFTGKVTRSAGRLDPETRNMRTEIDLSNPDGILYPGMYARVSLETELHQNVLTLPAAAVLSDVNGSFVVVVQDGRIQRQPVTTGLAEGGTVEIRAGLSETAEVVAVAQGAPPPGSLVTAIGR